jgi:hypothetical protein
VTHLVLAAALVAPALPVPLPPPAPAADVAAIAAEIDLPGVLPPTTATPLARLRFAAAALKDYAADVPLAEVRKAENAEKYAFRRAVLDALDACRGGWANDGRQLRPAIPAGITPLTKAEIAREQEALAVTIPRLEQAAFHLEAFESVRAREPKRWQAHFDLATAELHARIAVTQNYNYLLGQTRQENVPPLDPARHVGYKLVATDRATGPADVRRQAKAARERYEAVVRDHPGTPWAEAARRALAAPPGLAWEPAGRE